MTLASLGCEGVTLASLVVTVAVALAVGSWGDWDWKYGRRVDLVMLNSRLAGRLGLARGHRGSTRLKVCSGGGFVIAGID